MRRRERGSIKVRIPNEKYLIRWTVKDQGGKTVRHNRIVRGDYVEAQAALAKALRSPADSEVKITQRTFAGYPDNEWSQYTRDKWKESTRATQGSFVSKHIRPFFDGMVLAQIKPQDIAAFDRGPHRRGSRSQVGRLCCQRDRG